MPHEERRLAFQQRKAQEAAEEIRAELNAKANKKFMESEATRLAAAQAARTQATLDEIAYDQMQAAHYARMSFNSDFQQRMSDAQKKREL